MKRMLVSFSSLSYHIIYPTYTSLSKFVTCFSDNFWEENETLKGEYEIENVNFSNYLIFHSDQSLKKLTV